MLGEQSNHTVLGRLQADPIPFHASALHCSLPQNACSALLVCRPVSGVISWLLPQLQIAKTERNALYPDIQAHFDQGGSVSVLLSLMPAVECDAQACLYAYSKP